MIENIEECIPFYPYKALVSTFTGNLTLVPGHVEPLRIDVTEYGDTMTKYLVGSQFIAESFGVAIPRGKILGFFLNKT